MAKLITCQCGKQWEACDNCHDHLCSICAKFNQLKEAFDNLLTDAIHLYSYYPNNFRSTAEEYFKKELALKTKFNDKDL